MLTNVNAGNCEGKMKNNIRHISDTLIFYSLLIIFTPIKLTIDYLDNNKWVRKFLDLD